MAQVNPQQQATQELRARRSRILQSQKPVPKLSSAQQLRAAITLKAKQQQQKKQQLTEGVMPTPQIPEKKRISPITPVSPTVDTALLNPRLREQEQPSQRYTSVEQEQEALELNALEEQQRQLQLQRLQQDAQEKQAIQEQQTQNQKRIATLSGKLFNGEYTLIGGIKTPTPIKFARDRGWTWLYWIQIATIPLFGLLGLAYAALLLAMIISHTRFGRNIIGTFRGPSPAPFSHPIVGYLIVMVVGLIWGGIYLLLFTQLSLMAYIYTNPVDATLKFGEALVKLINPFK